MSLIFRANTITRRTFAGRGSLALAGGVIAPYILKGEATPKQEYRQAMFQQSGAKGVVCMICPNECTLKDGEISDCHNRIARNSKLYTMAFGNPCAVNVDPVEKKPLYHFLPGTATFSIATAGCNLACLNCQNWTISQTSPDKTQNYDLPPADVVANAKANNCHSIAYTYSEPVTFYEYVYETSKVARDQGIRNIMVSNGYINPEPLKELCRYIDAANIDLKAFSESTYLKLNGGKLGPVLEALKIYRDEGVWLEITNLVVPGWTDKPAEIKEMCRWLSDNGFRDTPLHFSRFQPQYKLENLPPTPADILVEAAAIAADAGLKYVYIGNMPGAGHDDTVCHACGEKIIERSGFRVTSNRVSNSKCRCGAAVSGVWK